MIGIIVALESESSSFLSTVKIDKTEIKGGKKIFFIDYKGKKIVYAISGIGKVNAAMTAQLLIDNYSPKLILNYGSAGGMNGYTKALDFYLIEKCCQYDFDLSPLDPVPVGYIQGYDKVFFELENKNITFLKKATLASSDRFTCKNEDINLLKKMGCTVFDMEASAIAEVCESNKMPFISIKGISDVNGSGIQPDQFRENFATLFERFNSVLDKTIEKL